MKIFRWLLFIPAGLIETCLLICVSLLILISKAVDSLAFNMFHCIKKLPGIEWYLGTKK